jgi:hypothetical protein
VKHFTRFAFVFITSLTLAIQKKMELDENYKIIEVNHLYKDCPVMIEKKKTKRRMKADKRNKDQKKYQQKKKMMKKQGMENQATSQQDDIHTTDENNEHNSTTIGDKYANNYIAFFLFFIIPLK